MVEQNQNEQNERLPITFKLANVIGKPFRVLGGPYTVLKSDYQYYQKYGKNLKFSKDEQGNLMRLDRENNQWVYDDKNNYWYDDEYGKRRNHIQANSRFIVEFKEPSTVEVYMGQKMSKTVNKCVVEMTGSGMFGQSKKLLDRLNEFEQMGHNRNQVYVLVTKEGRMYDFKFSGVVQNNQQTQTQQPNPQPTTPPAQPQPAPRTPQQPAQQSKSAQPQQTQEQSSGQGYNQNTEDVIAKLKEKGVTDKTKVKMFLTDKDIGGLGLDEETADKIIQERFTE